MINKGTYEWNNLIIKIVKLNRYNTKDVLCAKCWLVFSKTSIKAH
jgi:hypothetical protein